MNKIDKISSVILKNVLNSFIISRDLNVNIVIPFFY